MERQRRTERRQRQVRRSNLALLFVIFAQFLVIGVLLWRLQDARASSEAPITKPVQTIEEPMDVAWTKNGPVYTYVVGDPDYGHEYIVTSLGGIEERDTN